MAPGIMQFSPVRFKDYPTDLLGEFHVGGGNDGAPILLFDNILPGFGR